MQASTYKNKKHKNYISRGEKKKKKKVEIKVEGEGNLFHQMRSSNFHQIRPIPCTNIVKKYPQKMQTNFNSPFHCGSLEIAQVKRNVP